MPRRSIAAAKCSGVGSGWRPPSGVGGPGEIGVDVGPHGAREVPGLVGGAAGAPVEVPADVDDAHLVEVGGEPVGADEGPGEAIGHRPILRDRASRRSQRGAARPRRSGPARRGRARCRGPGVRRRAGGRPAEDAARRASARAAAATRTARRGRNSKNGRCGVTIARCAVAATEMPVFQACGTTSSSCSAARAQTRRASVSPPTRPTSGCSTCSASRRDVLLELVHASRATRRPRCGPASARQSSA